MWTTLMKLALFMLSSMGYWEYFKRKTKMNLHFLPAFTVCFQITALFIAGLFNCLEAMAILLFVMGLAFIAYYAYKDYKAFFDYCNIGYAFFFVALGVVLLAVRGRIFTNYDNFSHWALVVKNMLQTDRYPNFEDTLIMFQEYPLGSASFIYYFSKIISTAESIQMLAQSYMMVCFILPIFQYARKHKGIVLAYMALLTNFLFCYNIRITELLVDTLLPLQGMAALLFICSECLFGERDGREEVSVLCAIPFLCTAVQIKNSGIYFAAIGCILIFASFFQAGKRMNGKGLVTMAAPFLSLYLWKAHCSYVFAAASLSKHAMTADNYKQVYSSKTPEDINLIVKELLRFAISGRDLYRLIGFIVLAGLLLLFLDRSFKKKYGYFLCSSLVLYVTYMAGMLLMYLYSMPGGEATTLAGSWRYRSTIFIAIYYLMAVMVVQCISDIEAKISGGGYYGIAMLALLIAIWRMQGGAFVTIFPTTNTAEQRLWFENAISENAVDLNKSYVVCVPPDTNDAGYTYFLCKYLLGSNNVATRAVTEEAQTEDLQNYDYIFFYDSKNDIMNNWAEANYPEQAGKTVVTIAR